MSTVNNFPALTDPFQLIVISNFFIAFGAKSLTNSGKLSPAKVIAAVLSDFYLKLPNQEPKYSPN